MNLCLLLTTSAYLLVCWVHLTLFAYSYIHTNTNEAWSREASLRAAIVTDFSLWTTVAPFDLFKGFGLGVQYSLLVKVYHRLSSKTFGVTSKCVLLGYIVLGVSEAALKCFLKYYILHCESLEWFYTIVLSVTTFSDSQKLLLKLIGDKTYPAFNCIPLYYLYTIPQQTRKKSRYQRKLERLSANLQVIANERRRGCHCAHRQTSLCAWWTAPHLWQNWWILRLLFAVLLGS